MTLHESSLITGDDEGIIKVWDLRTQKVVHTLEDNEDFIGQLVYHQNLLLCASGDGTVSAYDIRKGKLKANSEPIEDEFLSLCILKNSTKVITGSQSGGLYIFNYGEWEGATDKFLGHPESVDTMVQINEDVICTGSSDGLIRVVAVHPNSLLGVIGEHEDFPIERLALARDKKYLASCSHDSTVKFWNMSLFFEEPDSDDSDSEAEQAEVQIDVEKLEAAQQTPQTRHKKVLSDFFSDM